MRSDSVSAPPREAARTAQGQAQALVQGPGQGLAQGPAQEQAQEQAQALTPSGPILKNTGPVWLDPAGFSPDQVQQGVGGAGHGLLAVLGVLLLGGPTRVDDVHHDDAHDHGHEGGPEVVGDGHDAQAAGALGVQGGEA